MSTKSVTLSALASAVAAFGLGALTMGGHDSDRPVSVSRPDTEPDREAATPDVTATPAAKTAKPKAPAKSTADTESSAGRDTVQTEAATPAAKETAKGKGKHRAAKPKARTARPKATKRPTILDRDGDGKVLDGVTDKVLPGVEIPDELLPFPGKGEPDPEPIAQRLPAGVVVSSGQEYPDPDAGTDPAGHVVSGEAVHTRPLPWVTGGHAVTGGPVAVEPVVSAPVVSGPVAGGPVSTVRPGPAGGVVSAVTGGPVAVTGGTVAVSGGPVVAVAPVRTWAGQ
ncbi:hypothetical protein ACWGH5_09690 [Streptomyces sp. NPDC054864]